MHWVLDGARQRNSGTNMFNVIQEESQFDTIWRHHEYDWHAHNCP